AERAFPGADESVGILVLDESHVQYVSRLETNARKVVTFHVGVENDRVPRPTRQSLQEVCISLGVGSHAPKLRDPKACHLAMRSISAGPPIMAFRIGNAQSFEHLTCCGWR